jgi:hypothetical protein
LGSDVRRSSLSLENELATIQECLHEQLVRKMSNSETWYECIACKAHLGSHDSERTRWFRPLPDENDASSVAALKQMEQELLERIGKSGQKEEGQSLKAKCETEGRVNVPSRAETRNYVAPEARVEGSVKHSDKDKMTFTLEKSGAQTVVRYDASTQWVSQYRGDKEVGTIDPSQVKDGDYVICIGSYGEFHPTLISKRWPRP